MIRPRTYSKKVLAIAEERSISPATAKQNLKFTPVRIPRDLHIRLKAHCELNDKSPTLVIKRLIQEYLDNQ